MTRFDRNALDRAREDEYFLNLEKRLLDPETRHSRAHLEFMIHDAFKEFGSSGRVYQKASIIAMMTREAPGEITIRDFRVLKLSEEAVLLTYRSVGQSGDVRRSSIWVNQDGRWRIIFHQGTPIRSRLYAGLDLPGT